MKALDIDVTKKEHAEFLKYAEYDSSKVPAVMIMKNMEGAWVYGPEASGKLDELMPTYMRN